MTQWQQVGPPRWQEVGDVRGPAGPSIEVVPFTMQGTLRLVQSVGRFPLVGPSRILSVAAMVEDAPTGAPIILDVRASGASIFASPADRPTIAAANRRAIVGPIVDNLLDEDDYLNIDVMQVGSLFAGAFLTVAIRLAHGGDTTAPAPIPSQ